MTQPLPEQALLACAARVQRSDQVVVGFADRTYRELGLNWLVSLERAGMSYGMLVCLDAETHALFAKRGLPSVCAPTGGGLEAIRLQRLRIVDLLVRSGLHVVHSDVDLAWLRDPGPTSLDPARSSLTASQGSVFPALAYQEWGFVLCSGLFALRSEPATRTLLRRWLEELSRLGSDQWSLNRVLLEHGAHWETEGVESYQVAHRGQRVRCYRETLRGQLSSLGLSLSLLPHHVFQRMPVPDADPVAIHPMLERGENHRQALERTGGWLLRSDWEQVAFDAGDLGAIAS